MCNLPSLFEHFPFKGAEEGLKDVEVSRKVRVQDEEPLKEDGESPKSGDIGSGCGSSRWTDHTFKIDHVKMWVEAGKDKWISEWAWS